jgi:predicted RecB family nuclease
MDRVSFRIYGAKLTIEEITQCLKATPAKVVRKGTPISKRNPSGAVHAEDIWIWKPRSTTLEKQLSEVSSFIRDHESIFSERLVTCTFDVLCTMGVEDSQRSLTLLAADLQPVVQIGADILLTAIDIDEGDKE